MKNYFKKVHVISQLKKSEVTEVVPENFIVHDDLFFLPNRVMSGTIMKNFISIISILGTELLHTKQRKFFLLNIRKFNSVLCQAFQKAEVVKKTIKGKDKSKILFYSYWMDDGALICAILKDQNLISDFVFRVHGFDLYEERREGNYIPFRYFNMQQSKSVHTISMFGNNYLKSKNIFPEKVINNYLGTFDIGINPFNGSDIFTLVSCSSIIPLKRVNLIIETLKHIEFPLRWIHFGDGILKNQLLMQAQTLPSNISWKLKGETPNKEVMNFYQNNSINMFIILSETEGLSFVLQEAASFGIPLLSTDVGGNSEIVSDITGILVDKDCSPEKIADLITQFKNSFKNSFEFHIEVTKFWEINFNAEINHEKFFKNIVNNACSN